MQSSLPAGWLASTGRELNPLDRYKRFQITFSSPFSGFILAQRTAGFPQYGWKAGFSGGVFPHCYRFKPAPGVHRQPSGLRSPFVHLIVTAVVPHCVGPWTRLRTALEVITPPPQGPSLGSGL